MSAIERPAPPPVIEANEVIRRLLDLPGEIAQVEDALLAAENDRRRVENAVTYLSDRLLIDGRIDGKNAEVREAQLRQALATEPGNPCGRLLEAERLPVFLKRELHRLQNEFAALRSVARLLAAFSSD